MPTNRRRNLLYPSLIAFVLFVAKAMFVAIISTRALVMTPWLIDDSFIIMRIARNLSAGVGYSFDGLNPTSGTALLWTVLTYANHFLFGVESAVKITVIETAFIGGICTVLVFYIAYKTFNNRVAWGAFILSSLSTPMFLNSINGMETSLFTLLGLSAFALYLNRDRYCGMGIIKFYFVLGALLGVANLVRGDGVFLALSIFVCEVIALIKSDPEERIGLAKGILVFGVAVVLFTLPVVLWNWHVTGALTPANQKGRQFLAWGTAMAEGGSVIWTEYLFKAAKNTVQVVILMSIIIGLPFLGFFSILHIKGRKHAARLAAPVTIYLTTYLVTLIFYQGYFPDVHGLRYFNLAGHLLSIQVVALIAAGIKKFIKKGTFEKKAYIAVISTLLISSMVQYKILVEYLGWSKKLNVIPIYKESEIEEYWGFLDWVKEHLPNGTVIAAADHGRLAYFTNVHIVDLAGIIDFSIKAHMEKGTLREYFLQRGVRYAILPKNGGLKIHKAIRETFDLERVAGCPGKEGSNHFLYSVAY